MAEALAALSLACNVIQVISFSRETISVCKKLYDGQSVDENLEFLAGHLYDLSKDLDDSIAARGNETALTGEQRNLQDVAQKCLDASTKLKKELSKFDNTSKRNLMKAVGKGLRKTLRKGKIGDIEKSLMECQNVLQTRLLTQLCSRTEAASLEQRTGFQDVSERTQDFVRQYASGCTKIEDLLAKEGAEMRSLVLREGRDTRAQLTQESSETRGVFGHESRETRAHVTMESDKTRENLSIGFQNVSSHANCEKLLASLKYDGMNARRNMIKKPEGKTFTWIFEKESRGPWDNFAEWLSCDHPIYWVSGKAGSGKSTLMKFIAESPSTRDALSCSSPSVLILSHYIWCSGTVMQRAFKGLLCSLLYGLLEKSETLPLDLLARFPSLSRKDSPDDWSEAELEELFAEAQTASATPIIMFVDGLDEIDAKEGPLKLLEFVEKMRVCPQTKICVSSRPEPQLKVKLNLYPKLKLQDLNNLDIREFVEKSLSKSAAIHEKINKSSRGFTAIIYSVVEKADGVFLWVVLALKSLQRGIDNEDSQEILLKRLDALPDDLLQLYGHMWKRLNGDHAFYLGEASLYFNMFLKADLNAGFGLKHSLFTFALQAHPSIQNEVLNDLRCPSADRLVQLISDIQKRVQIRCAGLLEWYYDADRKFLARNRNPLCPSDAHVDSQISAECNQCKNMKSSSGADDITKLNCDSVHRIEYSYKILRLRLIHRSAREFLLGSPDGQSILNYNTLSPGENLVGAIKSELVYAVWGRYSSIVEDLFPSAEGNFSDRISDSNQQQLLLICEKMYEKGLLFRAYPNGYFGNDFLGIAASIGLATFVQKRLVDLSKAQEITSEYCTYLLHRASMTHRRGIWWNCVKLIDWLLTKRGDIDPNKRISGFKMKEDFLSPFLGFIMGISDMFGFVYSDREGLLQKQVLPTLRRYIAAGANLQSTTYYFYCRTKISRKGKNCPGFEHVIMEVDAACKLHQMIEHLPPQSIPKGQIKHLLEGHAPYQQRVLAISMCTCECHIQDGPVSEVTLGEELDTKSYGDLEDVPEKQSSEDESLVGGATDIEISETTAPVDSERAQTELSEPENCCGEHVVSEYPYVFCQDCSDSVFDQATIGAQAYISVRDEDSPYLLEVLSRAYPSYGERLFHRKKPIDPETFDELRRRAEKVIFRNRKQVVDIRALLIERGHMPSEEDRWNAVPPMFK